MPHTCTCSFSRLSSLFFSAAGSLSALFYDLESSSSQFGATFLHVLIPIYILRCLADVVSVCAILPRNQTGLSITSSEAKLDALKERLASEVDEAAATLPTIIADSTDQRSLDSMVTQAKVWDTVQFKSRFCINTAVNWIRNYNRISTFIKISG